jgi:hypothetical protein
MTVGFLSRKVSPTPLLESLKVCHPVASELIESGTPITVVGDHLRHSDVRITLGIYGHVIGNSQRNAVNRLAKRLVAQSRSKESPDAFQCIRAFCVCPCATIPGMYSALGFAGVDFLTCEVRANAKDANTSGTKSRIGIETHVQSDPKRPNARPK